jgi:AcrR family transcriptional regulator
MKRPARAARASHAVRVATSPEPRRDLRIVRGEETHARILQTAMDVASTEGLEGLTIGRLATALGVSKAGLFAHFGSKEALQLATVSAARGVYFSAVIEPALSAPEGLPRLLRLCTAWLDYVQQETFRGGCFFAAASAEFDSRPGPVRDLIARTMREWLDLLESAVVDAARLGHVKKDVDPAQLAFELHAMEMAANWSKQLFLEPRAIARARSGVMSRLDAITLHRHKA